LSGGLEKAAIAATFPEWTLRGDIDHVRITRVDHNAADVLRILQPDVAESVAAILALVYAIPIDCGALAVILAGADSHNRRIPGIDGNHPTGYEP
jgi:hypothetical protein